MPDRVVISLSGVPVGVKAVPALAGAATTAPPTAAEVEAQQQESLDQARQSIDAERAELRRALDALNDGLTQLAGLREQIVKEAEGELAQLAVDIARKVLMQEIRAGRYEIDPIIREALTQVPPRQDVTVHVNPEDWTRCEMARESAGGGAGGNTRVVADPSVARGECVLETAEGVVQSAVEEHLERISDALRRVE